MHELSKKKSTSVSFSDAASLVVQRNGARDLAVEDHDAVLLPVELLRIAACRAREILSTSLQQEDPLTPPGGPLISKKLCKLRSRSSVSALRMFSAARQGKATSYQNQKTDANGKL